MQWLDTLAASVDPHAAHVINDSKTPSGRVHVGALRGVLIHDAVFRTLRARSIPVRYLFGVDDYDPLDELPAEHPELFRPYLGQPLCNVPAPPGSMASDLADHYISEFFEIFRELGVHAETYRMRDLYKSGTFNSAIATILAHADTVRRVYLEVSRSQRPPDWYPFQVVCEQCGRVGTTQVFDFDGTAVTYRCRFDLVKWATGCGCTGSVSPFDGNGKLPWKLEWVAKWATFPVTIEGAGKDHTTRGGSRDVAAACLRAIFGLEPPKNIPYEFFLVGGAKMSSSRGVGASARDIANLLPPQVLRYLVLKSQPSRPVNFAPEEEQIVKLFNEYDRLRETVVKANDPGGADARLLSLCRVGDRDPVAGYAPPFQLVATLLQFPHIDLKAEVEKRKGSPLTAAEQDELNARVRSAAHWLERYASEDERVRVHATLTPAAATLPAAPRGFLHRLAAHLRRIPWTEDDIQAAVFDAARTTPLDARQAFEAIYTVFLGRSSGPKAGSLLSFLDREMVLERLTALPVAKAAFWQATSSSLDRFEQWLAENADAIGSPLLRFERLAADSDGVRAAGVVELEYAGKDGRPALRRAEFSRIGAAASDAPVAEEAFEASAREYAAALRNRFDLPGLRLVIATAKEDLG